MVRQYVHKTFSNNYKSTIGALLSLPRLPRLGSSPLLTRAHARQAWTLR